MPYPMRQQPLRRRWVTVRDSRVKHFAAGVAEVLITAAGTSPFPVNKRYQLVLGEGLRQSGSQRNLSGKPVSDERRSASACALSALPRTVAMSDQLIDECIAVMKALRTQALLVQVRNGSKADTVTNTSAKGQELPCALHPQPAS